MSLMDYLFGRRLATYEEGEQRIGVVAGIPMLGLDALGSAAYGPEAALTLLIPLGAAGLSYIGPISTLIIVILAIVYFSYRQTITAYPQGGGSYTVAKENLGTVAGLLAAAALMLDYVLVVAVGISAGVGALVSAITVLQPFTLWLCLAILLLITMVNLRGVRESGSAFMIPTYVFIVSLLAVVAIGVVKAMVSGGHPAPVAAPPALPAATMAGSLWISMRAFASGCTAMTGVEAVSNGVTAFREPVGSPRPEDAHGHHRDSRPPAGGDRVSLSGIRRRRHGAGTRRLSEHPVDAGGRGYRPGSFLLHHDRLGPLRPGPVGEHGICRFSPPLPVDRPGWIPAARICPPGPAARLFTGHSRPGRAFGRAPDRVRRDHRQPDSPFRGRRVPGLHALSGRHGRALAARREGRTRASRC